MKDLEDLAMEEKFWGVYDNNKRNIMLQNTMYDEGVSDGLEQGIELGKEQGIELGKEQGIELGKEQGINSRNIEIAKNMKENGENIEKISKYTDLSIEEINMLNCFY